MAVLSPHHRVAHRARLRDAEKFKSDETSEYYVRHQIRVNSRLTHYSDKWKPLGTQRRCLLPSLLHLAYIPKSGPDLSRLARPKESLRSLRSMFHWSL
jgi:hypothetical protein